MAKQTDSLKQLIDALQEHEKKISAENATAEDVFEMQMIANWVYEKTTWIKFKTMSGEKQSEPEASTQVESKPSTVETSEKIVEETPVKEEPKEERPSFDFSAAFSAPKEEEKEDTKTNTFVEQEAPKEEVTPQVEEEDEETQTSLLDAIGTDDESINESLMEEEDNSLASKMQKSPLSDIKDAIGMNDRFSYINELFEENADAYNQAIGKLNGLNNKVEAKEKLSEMAIDYDWDLENKLVQKFVEIVERRYS